MAGVADNLLSLQQEAYVDPDQFGPNPSLIIMAGVADNLLSLQQEASVIRVVCIDTTWQFSLNFQCKVQSQF